MKKVPLMISGEEATLLINEVEEDDEGNFSVPGANRENSAQIRLLLSTVRGLSRQNEELKNELAIFKSTCNTLLEQLNVSVRRLAVIPGARVRRGRQEQRGERGEDDGDLELDNLLAGGGIGGGAAAVPYEFTLSKKPSSLHVLWQEYEFGIGGRKAAKEFSASERGRVKFNYSLRNHFWQLLKDMIRRGYTHTAAIDKIYSVYGKNLSTTRILREIWKDTKNGGHALLRS